MSFEDRSCIEVASAESQLPQVISRVASGEEIVLNRSDRPAAMLVPLPGDFKADGLDEPEGEIWLDPAIDCDEVFAFVSSGGGQGTSG